MSHPIRVDANTTPADLVTNPSLLTHKKPASWERKPYSARDGCIGAVLEHGKFFITTPNANFIPQPQLSTRHTRLREDLRYADDDPGQWAQPFNARYSHLACIPLRPTAESPLAIMWWNLQTEDFVPAVEFGETGMGMLAHRRLKVFEDSVQNIQSRVNTYCNTHTLPNKIVPRLFNHLTFSLSHLKTLAMTFRQLRQTITELQRIYLELWGALTWVEIYQPRFDVTDDFSSEVGSVVGSFLVNIQDAEQFFRIGLPFWLVRPFKYLSVTRVDAISEIRRPEDTLCFADATPRFPEIFTGTSHDVRRFEAMANNTSRFLRYDNPFALMSAPASANIASPPQAGPSRTPRFQGTAGQVQPYDKNARPSAAAKQGNQGRDKFMEPTHHLVPPTTTAWAQALSSINRDKPSTSSDSRYALPEPGLFIGVANEQRMQQYILTWLRYRPRMLNLFMGSNQAVALPSQGWRTFLGHETIQLSNKKGFNKRSRNTGVDEGVRTLLANCSSVRTTAPSAPKPSWNRRPVASDAMPSDAIIREVLWELYELNFVFELTELDLRANPASQESQEDHEDQRRTIRYEAEDRAVCLGACFKGGLASVLSPSSTTSAVAGLAARTLVGRIPYISALRDVMVHWPGGKDVLGPERVHNWQQYDTKKLEEMEAKVTRFYCQSFFDFFGRAPLLPHRIDTIASNAASSSLSK